MHTFKNLFINALILFCLLQSSTINAHAVVTKASINIAPITANQSTEVSVDFNSHIEIALSQVFLVRAGDKEELLPISAGKKAGQLLLTVPALQAGEYALHFKVFAADGHLTEDIIHFVVKP